MGELIGLKGGREEADLGLRVWQSERKRKIGIAEEKDSLSI